MNQKPRKAKAIPVVLRTAVVRLNRKSLISRIDPAHRDRNEQQPDQREIVGEADDELLLLAAEEDAMSGGGSDQQHRRQGDADQDPEVELLLELGEGL